MTSFKKILLALMLLTFIGQGVASTLSHCLSQKAPPSEAHEQMADMMDHSQHMQSQSEANSDISHCEMQSCECSLGGCFFAMLPASDSVLSLGFHTLDNHYQSSRTKQSINSLFRPPISG